MPKPGGGSSGRISAAKHILATNSPHKYSEKLSDALFGKPIDEAILARAINVSKGITGLTSMDMVSSSIYEKGLPYAYTGNVSLKNLNKIKTTQGMLSTYRLNDLYQGTGKSYGNPLIVKYKGQYIIRDGNHRVAAAILQGKKSIQADIFDVDKALKS